MDNIRSGINVGNHHKQLWVAQVSVGEHNCVCEIIIVFSLLKTLVFNQNKSMYNLHNYSVTAIYMNMLLPPCLPDHLLVAVGYSTLSTAVLFLFPQEYYPLAHQSIHLY